MPRRFLSATDLILPQPADSGFKTWSSDPASGGAAGVIPTAGTLYIVRFVIPERMSISNIWLFCGTAGVTLTNFGVGIWGGGVGGALVTSSVVAGNATAMQSTGMKQLALSTAILDGAYYFGFWATGTTLPAIGKAGGGNSIQFSTLASTPRFATANTGLTNTAPATLGTISAFNGSAWLIGGS